MTERPSTTELIQIKCTADQQEYLKLTRKNTKAAERRRRRNGVGAIFVLGLALVAGGKYTVDSISDAREATRQAESRQEEIDGLGPAYVWAGNKTAVNSAKEATKALTTTCEVRRFRGDKWTHANGIAGRKKLGETIDALNIAAQYDKKTPNPAPAFKEIFDAIPPVEEYNRGDNECNKKDDENQKPRYQPLQKQITQITDLVAELPKEEQTFPLVSGYVTEQYNTNKINGFISDIDGIKTSLETQRDAFRRTAEETAMFRGLVNMVGAGIVLGGTVYGGIKYKARRDAHKQAERWHSGS